MQSVINESELIEAAKKNPQQFRPLYEKYFKDVYLFIYRRLDDEHDAADFAQQVFLKAMQHLKYYEDRGVPFGAWLIRIASNEVNQYFRDRKKERTVSMELTDLNEILDENDSHLIQERREATMQAIKKLTGEELELIEMRYFEKRSFAEVAEIKGMTENNAKVKVHRILERLRKQLTTTVKAA